MFERIKKTPSSGTYQTFLQCITRIRFKMPIMYRLNQKEIFIFHYLSTDNQGFRDTPKLF